MHPGQQIFVVPSVTSPGILAHVGNSGTTAKSRKRKLVPSSHPGPFAVVASAWKRQTKVGTLACFDFCKRMS